MFKNCFTEPVFKFIFCQEKDGGTEKGLLNVHNNVLLPPDVSMLVVVVVVPRACPTLLTSRLLS